MGRVERVKRWNGWKRDHRGLGSARQCAKQRGKKIMDLIYPETRTISEDQLIVWANDAYENGEVEHAPESLQDAIEMLEDAGLVTVKKELTLWR